MYDFFIEYPFEVAATWSCEQCAFTWEALLLGEHNRYIGQVWDVDTSKVLWSGKMPKDRDRALIMLELELVRLSDRHKSSKKHKSSDSNKPPNKE